MPVAPAARVCPDSHSMCRHRGGVSSPPRTRHHASCIGLPSCSGASSRGACLPTAWTLRARARTRSKLLIRGPCAMLRRLYRQNFAKDSQSSSRASRTLAEPAITSALQCTGQASLCACTSRSTYESLRAYALSYSQCSTLRVRCVVKRSRFICT